MNTPGISVLPLPRQVPSCCLALPFGILADRLSPCPSAAQVRFRCADVPVLASCNRGGCELDPTPLRRIRSHVVHSDDVIVTTFGAFLQAETRRSSIRTRPSP